MAPRSRGAERALSAAVTSPKLHICRSCLQSLSRRSYASTATATAQAPPVSQVTPDLPGSSPAPQPKYTINAGIVLSRAPLITPDPHPFETAYHLYQRRLNERLVLPFTQYFYYKKGTPAFEHWRKRRSERGWVAARDIGKYNAYTAESWNDEVLVGDQAANPEKLVTQLVDEEGRQNEFVGESGLTETAGLKRRTQADEKNDQRSLERKLQRTLYLLVKKRAREGKPESWVFPTGVLEGGEGLSKTAKRVLDQACGPKMNTWFVGRHPIGHYISGRDAQDEPSTSQSQKNDEQSKQVATVHDTAVDAGEKTFFMKARIFAGQADLKSANGMYEDFKWLAKEEIEKLVHSKYWARIKNMLVEQ